MESEIKGPTFVVGLGASAGGLEALERFFDTAPIDSGGAFVVVMHLARDFRSVLDELLARHTQMPVYPIKDGDTLVADTVYVIQPGTEVEVQGKTFRVTSRPAATTTGRVSSIDILFQSIATSWREKGAAVILSGSGSDGAHGVVAVHAAGGLVLAQSPESSKFDSMPIAAIATNSVSGVDTPELLALLIQESIHLPRLGQAAHKSTSEAAALQRILSAVVGSSHLDASQYTQSTFERRVQRRMREVHSKSLTNYSELIERDRTEARALSETLLIGVTDFFRDEPAFNSLARHVAPDLIRRAAADQRPVRIWVPGCASGEEAYSLAILFAEASADFPSPVDIQIFATDVHKGLLAEAARGEYTSERMQSVSEARRRAFFTRTASGAWHLDTKIRKTIVFAPHDVLIDPPFTRLDLVSCRNLLIYFSVEAQQRVIGSFAFGLMEKGYLFLGGSETVGAQRESFEFVDVRRRIFRRTRAASRSPTLTGAVEPYERLGISPAPSRRSLKSREAMLQPAYSALLKAYAPPCFLISGDRYLLHTFGEARKFLRAPEGVARLDITDMCDPALKTPLAAGIDRVIRDKETITFSRVELQTFPQRGMVVDVVIQPLMVEVDSTLALVMIKEVDLVSQTGGDTPAESDIGRDAEARISELQIEVLRTREALQATIEEIETANEELQATNEELMSSNEELQSTNEELSSLNEELHSVNAEHFRQNDELVRLTRDFDALLHATEIGVLFFDEALNIRRFTRLVAELFQFTETDIGRSLRTFRSPFPTFDIEGFLGRIMRGGLVEEAEVYDSKTRTWLLRAAGYPDQKGVVLSIISITRLRDGEASPGLLTRDRILATAAPFGGDPVVVVTPHEGSIRFANASAAAKLGLPEEPNTDLRVSRITPEWGDPAWIAWLSAISVGGQAKQLDVTVIDRYGKLFSADMVATIIADDREAFAVIRFTENRDRVREIRDLKERTRMFAISNRELEQFATVVAHDLRAPLRHLNQFSEYLMAELGPSASEQVNEYLHIISSSASNMSNMVERLMDYSRIGAGAPVFEVIDLNECLDKAKNLLASDIQAAGATLHVQQMPVVKGDKILLVRVFQNLIINALKFGRTGTPVVMYVTSKVIDDWSEIYFQDNGIGIQASNAHNIFNMFSRLHSDTEYAGHGMGLAICKRVCEIHGGSISLDTDSRPDEGARFIVRLPKVKTKMTGGEDL